MTPFLDDALVRKIDSGHCPDCGHRGFVLGPRGGSAMNIECGNVACLARFNIGQHPFNHTIVMAHRIARRGPEGGADNWGYEPGKERSACPGKP